MSQYFLVEVVLTVLSCSLERSTVSIFLLQRTDFLHEFLHECTTRAGTHEIA